MNKAKGSQKMSSSEKRYVGPEAWKVYHFADVCCMLGIISKEQLNNVYNGMQMTLGG